MRLSRAKTAVLAVFAEGASLRVCYHDSMVGQHLGDEIWRKETMLWVPHRPYGERREAQNRLAAGRASTPHRSQLQRQSGDDFPTHGVSFLRYL
jgi:hypothetical protein